MHKVSNLIFLCFICLFRQLLDIAIVCLKINDPYYKKRVHNLHVIPLCPIFGLATWPNPIYSVEQKYLCLNLHRGNNKLLKVKFEHQFSGMTLDIECGFCTMLRYVPSIKSCAHDLTFFSLYSLYFRLNVFIYFKPQFKKCVSKLWYFFQIICILEDRYEYSVPWYQKSRFLIKMFFQCKIRRRRCHLFWDRL